jgi:hypothetical protein
MNRLQAEFHRLYFPLSPEATGADSGTRALVLELARPADWERLSKAWRGVQTDLELPAPAIAVSGTDGIQLWFSLCEPVSVAQAHAFLESLRCRYLPDVAPQRVRLMPAVDVSTAPGITVHAPRVPALQGATGNWSAFVAPDLAPLFSETPWLDIPPGDDGQANLLSRLDSIKPPLFAAALAQLRAAEDQVTADKLKLETAASPVSTQKRTYGRDLDPKSFLLAVMNDDGASLALRIEAAKALLPYAADVRA